MEEFSVSPAERLYEIDHSTRYTYGADVTLSPQILRLTPRRHRHTAILSANPEGNLRPVWDAYENPTHVFEWIGPTRLFEVRHQIRVSRTLRDPFDFLLSPPGARIPVEYSSVEREALEPFLSSSRETRSDLPASAADLFPGERETVAFLVGLNKAIHQEFEYETREEPGVLSPSILLERRKGSCRDFAGFLLALLRKRGFAARFTSGYLLETGDRAGSDAMHAWAEVFLPGAGWIGMDPTNGVLCDDSFVPCAVASSPPQAAPIEGRYYADERVDSTLEAKLRITTSGSESF